MKKENSFKKRKNLIIVISIIIFLLIFVLIFRQPITLLLNSYEWEASKLQSSANNSKWSCLACSDNGKFVIATIYGGYIYISYDDGKEWIENSNVGKKYWISATCSSSGKYIYLIEEGGFLYRSSSYGKRFDPITSTGIRLFKSITTSNDGRVVYAAVSGEYGGYIYKSKDYGENFEELKNSGIKRWKNIQTSKDGRVLVAISEDGYFVYSKDGGSESLSIKVSADDTVLTDVSLIDDGKLAVISESTGYLYLFDIYLDKMKKLNETKDNWSCVYISSRTKRIIATDLHNYIYISNSLDNENILWEKKSYDSLSYIKDICCSEDLSLIYLIEENGYIAYSNDFSNNFVKLQNVGIRYFRGVDCSADGCTVTAVISYDSIYISTDYAKSWKRNDNLEMNDWSSIKLSSDGKNQIATVEDGYVYISFDNGENFKSILYPGKWISSDCSGDFSVIYLADMSGKIYRYSPYADKEKIQQLYKEKSKYWRCVDCSRDGFWAIGGCVMDYFTIYSNYGYSYEEKTYPGKMYFKDAALSADGKVMTIIEFGGHIYTSYDYGKSWKKRYLYDRKYWSSICMSNDGKILGACEYGGYIYFSNDRGKTWVRQESAGKRNWSSICCSDNGNIFYAVAYGNNNVWIGKRK